MKIIYLIAATHNSGGMERVLANKANYLVAYGYDVSIITTDQRELKPFFALDERIRCYDLGINYEENNGKTFLNKLVHYPFKQWRHKMCLTKLLKELKADIVISMFCNDASILPRINDGSKKILEVHFSRFKRLQYGRKGIWRIADEWRTRNDKQVAARFDRFVVLTQEDRTYWGDISNIRVIPNARTYTFNQPATLNNKTVLAAGRYSHQKGFRRLIDAWKLVCKEVNDWNLLIVGDGVLRQDLLRQIEENELNENITLKKVQANKMPEVYSNASIFALSSYYEGLPMVLLEAQAAGLPIVSFACKCGPKDIIEDGVNGFLVEEGDVDTLAGRLLDLINDVDLRKKMGRASYRNSTYYTEEVIMKQWEELFQQVMKR